MPLDLLELLPLATADLPGIGGRIKQAPEDFEVEEIPLYEPSGTGSFLYLWIEKRDLGAEYFQRQVAHRLGLSAIEVGMAGLKDRRALTRQMVSVPERAGDRLAQLNGAGIRLLHVSRHGNKLRPGHLKGNRFRLLIRGVDGTAGERLGPLLARLKEQGLPNFYGPQRFGRDAETARVGLALLRGEPQPPRASGRSGNSRSRFLRKLALSAAQAVLFNRYLARRMADGLLQRVVPGDVMVKRPFGGLFVATDVAREQERFAARQTVHTGPIFGRKTFAAAAEAAARESAILQEAGLAPQTLAGFGKLLQGTRRPNLVYVDDLSAALESEGVRVSFTLPPGSYATVLLGELMKHADFGAEEVP